MKTRLITAVAVALGSVPLHAADLMDSAPVISATPIVDRVTEPRQECAPASQRAPQQERSVAAPIIGGVAGALLGSVIGRGRGRDAATAVGAVAGTVIGDRVGNPDSDRSVTGAVVGGAAGGLLGHQVGRGNGRTAATAAGAIGGAVVGDQVGNRQTASQQPQQQCRTVDSTREILRGYNVVYRYNGRDVTTTMPYDPGNHVRVAVTAVDSTEKPVAQAPTGTMRGGNVREVSAPRAQGYPRQPVYTGQRDEQRSEPRDDYTYRY
jgi:uncharacterized protein YcfJ